MLWWPYHKSIESRCAVDLMWANQKRTIPKHSQLEQQRPSKTWEKVNINRRKIKKVKRIPPVCLEIRAMTHRRRPLLIDWRHEGDLYLTDSWRLQRGGRLISHLLRFFSFWLHNGYVAGFTHVIQLPILSHAWCCRVTVSRFLIQLVAYQVMGNPIRPISTLLHNTQIMMRVPPHPYLPGSHCSRFSFSSFFLCCRYIMLSYIITAVGNLSPDNRHRGGESSGDNNGFSLFWNLSLFFSRIIQTEDQYEGTHWRRRHWFEKKKEEKCSRLAESVK